MAADMEADTEAETTGRTIRITAGVSLTPTTGSPTVSEGPHVEIIDSAAEDLIDQPVVTTVGLREDSMGLPADKPADNASPRSGTRHSEDRIQPEDRLSLMRIDRKSRLRSLRWLLRKGAASAIATRGTP